MNAIERPRWPHPEWLALLWLLPATAADPLPPEELIASTAEQIAVHIHARHSELEDDRDQLEALIDELLRPHFDLESASRLILREHWKNATIAQRGRFVTAFYRFLVSSYGGALLHFDHDTLSVTRLGEPAGNTPLRVQTTMKLNDGNLYHVEFYMRPGPQGWKIVDIIAEGVSYVRTYRSDYGPEVRERGLDGLIERLERLAARE